MPTEPRGEIGAVKPTGWHLVKYDNVDGKYLYNRCHLIAYMLAAENANPQNLITGTRYLNVQGMLPFETKVCDYIKNTGNHVLYRVTPIFDGDNLLADGVLMEAYSVEDVGEGIQFCVFAYNVQPGIGIDYATGDNWAESNAASQEAAAPIVIETPTQQPQTDTTVQITPEPSVPQESQETTYVLNTNTMKFHYPSCSSVDQMKEKNKYYFGKNGQAVTGKKNISHYLCYFNKKGVLTRKIDKNKKMVALTYDDGPSVYTPTILKTLKKNDSVATFFVVGSRVSTYSKTVQKAYDNGCQIGNHTYDHKILTRVGKKEVQKQVSKTNRAVKKVIGINPVVMRPPGGATSSNIKSWVGMPSIIWSIDTLDWKTRDSASTQKAVLNHVKDGDIVLMHDLYKATATASQTIIPELTRRGYQLVTVSELAECRGGMKQNKSYSKFPKKQK